MPQIRKQYVCFNVGVMMKARREFREEAAINIKAVQELKKTVNAVAAKKRRLGNRVNIAFFNIKYGV